MSLSVAQQLRESRRQHGLGKGLQEQLGLAKMSRAGTSDGSQEQLALASVSLSEHLPLTTIPPKTRPNQ